MTSNNTTREDWTDDTYCLQFSQVVGFGYKFRSRRPGRTELSDIFKEGIAEGNPS
jgi:hypothetical protein